jgi:hypothetical protein
MWRTDYRGDSTEGPKVTFLVARSSRGRGAHHLRGARRRKPGTVPFGKQILSIPLSLNGQMATEMSRKVQIIRT